MNKNDVFNAVVPAYVDDEQNNEIEGSTTEYELKSPDGKEINPDQNLSGEDAKSAYYMVTVEVDSDEHGIAIGQGIRQEGNFAKVEAVAKEGYQFVGWYENDKLISQETQYRFCVEKDTLLVAKFEKDGESANPENPKFFPDFGCRTVGWQRKNQFSYRTSGADQLADNRKISH